MELTMWHHCATEETDEYPPRDIVGKTVQYDGREWWTQRTIIAGQKPPEWFYAISTDAATRKTTGWIPARDSTFWNHLAEAINTHPPVPSYVTSYYDDGQIADDENPWRDRKFPIPDSAGIYELTGPRINGNPTGDETHQLRLIEKTNPPIRNKPRAIPQQWYDLTPQLTNTQILALPKKRQQLMGTAIRLMYATAQNVHPVSGISMEPRPFHVEIQDGNIHCDANLGCGHEWDDIHELDEHAHLHIRDTRPNHAAPVPQELEDIAEILIDKLVDVWKQLTRDERRVVYFRFAGDASHVYPDPEEETERIKQ